MMEGAAVHDDSPTLSGNVAFKTPSIPPADTSLYSLPSEVVDFFKAQIGYILEVQAKAYKIAPYSWIRAFMFLHVKISSNPVYEHILKLGRERTDAVLLDIGCCFGVDARKAAADGFPAKNIIASDIHKEFLQLSHELFKTTPASYPGCLLSGDVFNPAFLSIVEPSDDVSPAPVTDLSSLKSLNALHGRISAINATRFFHHFDEEKQFYLARALAGLLSAQPGSVICGYQVGILEKGIVFANRKGSECQSFSHSPESWSSLWDGGVFKKGSVKVETELEEVTNHKTNYPVMKWSVMIL
ncbi:hypothetical protein EDB19DRAFT_1987914 [Suillus lakei]|nr:hypothetical protein EDB19DRAFT_1987914 [Suillus lakei]